MPVKGEIHVYTFFYAYLFRIQGNQNNSMVLGMGLVRNKFHSLLRSLRHYVLLLFMGRDSIDCTDVYWTVFTVDFLFQIVKVKNRNVSFFYGDDIAFP